MQVGRSIQRVLASTSRLGSRGVSSSVVLFDEKDVYVNPNAGARKKPSGSSGPGAKGNQQGGKQQGLFKRLRSEVKGEKRPSRGPGDGPPRNRRPQGSSPQRGGGVGGGGGRGGVMNNNNNKGAFNNRRSGAGPRLGGGGSGDGDGGGRKKWVKGGKGGKGRRDKDHSRRDYTGDGIPEAIQALLYDHEFFKAQALKGKGINTRDMDGIDTFFAQSFMESNKTENSELRTVIEDESRRRVQIPRARGIEDLFYDAYSQIGEVDEGLNEAMGSDFAANLNETLQRNVYYSAEEKQYMMSLASSLGVKYLNRAGDVAAEATRSATEDPDNMYEGYDMIFSSKFRKGLPGMEAEKAHRASIVSRGEVVDYSQEDTDWDKDAVVDEDDL